MENWRKKMPKEDYPGQADGLMIRCPKCKRENWGPAVSSNRCVWCGYDPKVHKAMDWENRSTQGIDKVS